jgi:hypothetical protein
LTEQGWKAPVTAPEVFEAMADGEAAAAPMQAALLRRCASDSLALSLLPDSPTWDMPHRLLAGTRWLVLSGEAEDFEEAPDPWGAFHTVLAEHGDWLARFVRERPVQTNEVQRCWALLPIFLTIAHAANRPLHLVELGTSAGLNLIWDRYGYRYDNGTWGDLSSPLQLMGEERPRRVPAELLRVDVDIGRRLGIDLHPVDVTSGEGLRLLDTFVRDDGYRSRLRRAADVLRIDPPELLRGDYLELLPEILLDPDDYGLMVVFQTVSTVYLSDEERARLRGIIDAAGAVRPLAWISTPTPEEHGQRLGDYPLELAIWPGGERRIVARMNVRGEWLDWSG